MGLRLVGLLPCAVWTPKIPKPTIAGQARVTTHPYPIPSVTGGSTATVVPLTANRLLTRPNTSSCRCSNSQQLANRPSTVNISSASTVAQVTQPISQIASAIRPSSTVTTSNNPMLLVPFAVPGFVPVQGQQQQQQQTAIQTAAQHAHHIQQPSSSIQQQPQHQHSLPPPATHVQQAVNGTTLIVSPSPCNNGNPKVSLLISFFKISVLLEHIKGRVANISIKIKSSLFNDRYAIILVLNVYFFSRYNYS